MSEDVYVLKTTVKNFVLEKLNEKHCPKTGNLWRAIDAFRNISADNFPSLESVEEWTSALKSGKKIVNPRTDAESLNEIKKKHNYYSASRFGTPITLEFEEYIQLIKWSEKSVCAKAGDPNA